MYPLQRRGQPLASLQPQRNCLLGLIAHLERGPSAVQSFSSKSAYASSVSESLLTRTHINTGDLRNLLLEPMATPTITHSRRQLVKPQAQLYTCASSCTFPFLVRAFLGEGGVWAPVTMRTYPRATWAELKAAFQNVYFSRGVVTSEHQRLYESQHRVAGGDFYAQQFADYVHALNASSQDDMSLRQLLNHWVEPNHTWFTKLMRFSMDELPFYEYFLRTQAATPRRNNNNNGGCNNTRKSQGGQQGQGQGNNGQCRSW